MYDVGIMGNGALAGLVAITSGTSTVYPWAAIIIGLVAGALYCAGSRASIAMHVRGSSALRPSFWCHPVKAARMTQCISQSIKLHRRSFTTSGWLPIVGEESVLCASGVVPKNA